MGAEYGGAMGNTSFDHDVTRIVAGDAESGGLRHGTGRIGDDVLDGSDDHDLPVRARGHPPHLGTDHVTGPLCLHVAACAERRVDRAGAREADEAEHGHPVRGVRPHRGRQDLVTLQQRTRTADDRKLRSRVDTFRPEGGVDRTGCG